MGVVWCWLDVKMRMGARMYSPMCSTKGMMVETQDKTWIAPEGNVVGEQGVPDAHRHRVT